jgi:hypothetical protein
MKTLLIIGIIVFSLGGIICVWAILLTMSMARHPGAHESFVEFGSGLAVSAIGLIVCVALLIKRRGGE